MPLYRFGKHIRVGDGGAQTSKRLYTKVIAWTLVAFIPLIVYIYFSIQPPAPVAGKTINKGYFDPYKTWTTDWFTFRTDSSWEEVPEITKPNQIYTYRQKNGGNPQGLFQIYVENTPLSGAESYFSNVLPIEISAEGVLKPGSIQPKCDDLIAKGKTLFPQDVKQADVTFNCWPGTTQFYAVAGQVGGTSTMQIKRPNGEIAPYIITYRNLGFYSSESTFVQVMSTFKVR